MFHLKHHVSFVNAVGGKPLWNKLLVNESKISSIPLFSTLAPLSPCAFPSCNQATGGIHHGQVISLLQQSLNIIKIKQHKVFAYPFIFQIIRNEQKCNISYTSCCSGICHCVIHQFMLPMSGFTVISFLHSFVWYFFCGMEAVVNSCKNSVTL